MKKKLLSILLLFLIASPLWAGQLQDNIEQTIPSCVYVEAMVEVEQNPDDWFGNIFDFILGVKHYERMRTGSGIVISPVGVILTAGHVIEDADYFIVRFPDGQEYKSIDHKYSEKNDIGAIRIKARNLPYIEIGDTNSHRLGDAVYMIGCPYGTELMNTVTVGVISGMNRNIEYFGEDPMLQVDAAGNPGNSGGGVFDDSGELIGVLVGTMYGADGLGLCTATDTIQEFLDAGEKNGR